LLDHEYTQSGLSWARLKGSDASRAATVRAAARAADCEVALALAEVHETWSADEAEPSWGRGRRGRYWDEDEDDEDGYGDGSSDDYELQELIESTTSLDYWLDESDEAAPTSLTVSDDEVCATTPTADLSPRESSYEGYMGNYGNTLDRWYRRAAIVLWPRRWAFAGRAEAAPGWALARLPRPGGGGGRGVGPATRRQGGLLLGGRGERQATPRQGTHGRPGSRRARHRRHAARAIPDRAAGPHPCGTACPARGTLRRVLGPRPDRGLVRPRPTSPLVVEPAARGLAPGPPRRVPGAPPGAHGPAGAGPA